MKKLCLGCNTEFTTNYKNKLYCTRACMHKTVASRINDRQRQIVSSQLELTETEFSSDKYTDKLVDYPTATGKAYIGFAKQPLMKTNTGFGFQGVLVQSENRSLVQCSECGEWMKQITIAHLKKHGLTMKEYREKFGLNYKTGLCSDVRGNQCAKQVFEQINKPGKRVPYDAVAKRLQSKNREMDKTGIRNKIKGTMQQKNKWGTCPEQLKFETFEYIKRFNRLPTNCAISRGGFSKAKTLISRFGSLNNAMKEYGLPTRYRMGSRTHYVFEDGTTHVQKQGESYELLTHLLYTKCSQLRNHIDNA